MRRFPEMRPIAGHRVAALAAVLAAAASAAPAEPTAGHSGLLEFVGARQDRRFTQVPRRVMAFYYTWSRICQIKTIIRV